MTIRPANSLDTERLLEMAQHFATSTDYGAIVRPDPARLLQLISFVRQNGVIFVGERRGRVEGFLPLVVLPHIMSGELYADELAWWVELDARSSTIGPRLLDAGEEWARSQKLSAIKMTAPVNAPHVGEYYRRRGYRAIEVAFHMRL